MNYKQAKIGHRFVACLVLVACKPTGAGETVRTPPPARIPTYTISDIGTLPEYEQSYAFAINNQGDVAGASLRYVFRGVLIVERRAFVYTDGEITDLGTSESYSTADAINDSRQVAGWTADPGQATHSFLHTSETLQDLGVLTGETWSMALDMNNHTQVVGVSGERGFLWTGGMMIDLGSLDDRDTIPQAINDEGTVIGYSEVWIPTPPFHEPRAFIWQDGEMNELPRVSSGWSKAYDINDLGEIVGYSSGAAIWHGGFVELLADPPSSIHGSPRSINNQHDVVGQGGTLSDPHAAIWRDRAQYDLTTLLPPNADWHLEIATGVNDAGEICGHGTHSRASGLMRAFLLSPVDCDVDDDGEVDGLDFALMQACLAGPSTPAPPNCETFDVDRDGDVDFTDYRSLELAFLPIQP